MNINSPSVWALAGRESEMKALVKSFECVRAGGGPRVVTIAADSGVGKTRLLVELFAILVRDHDATGYWPSALPQDPAAVQLNPRPSDFSWHDDGPGNPSFWWWAMRFSDPSQRNTTMPRSGAIPAFAPELFPHFAFVEHKSTVLMDQKSAVDLCIDALIEFGPAILDVSLPGVGLMKTVFSKAREKHRNRRDLARMVAEDRDRTDLTKSRSKKTEERLLSGLIALTKLKAERNDVESRLTPLIVCLDDAHWIDADSASLIAKLLTQALAHRLPVLIVATAWPSEWNRLFEIDNNDSVTELIRVLKGLAEKQASSDLLLTPCTQIDRLIESSLPGLPVEQRRLIAAKVGADLYGLHLLIEDLLNRNRLFQGEDINASLTLDGERHISRIEHLRLDIVRKRFQELPPAVRDILSIAATFGRSFVVELVCEVCQQLGKNEWDSLQRTNPKEALRAAYKSHRYIATVSSLMDQFIDDAKFIVAREAIEDSSVKLEEVRTTTLFVLSRWFDDGKFDQFSWDEAQHLFDVTAWVLEGSNWKEFDKYRSIRSSVAIRLLTLQDIMNLPSSGAARSVVEDATGVLELDRAAFRAALPLRWQARWLLRRATDYQTLTTADTSTFLELIQAARAVVIRAVEAFKLNRTWQGAETLSNAATALVSLTWAAINQQFVNRRLEFDAPTVLDEEDLLNTAAQHIESCLAYLDTADSIEVAVRCWLLYELAEAAPKSTEFAHRNRVRDRLSIELLRLLQSQGLSEECASLLFEGPFSETLEYWPFADRAHDSYRIAQALSIATNYTSLEALGNFQLALRSLALSRVYGGPIDSIAERLVSIETCNFSLIARGMASLVEKHTWRSDSNVRLAARTLPLFHSPEMVVEDQRDLAWNSATRTITRLFEAEVEISTPVLVRLCERTLLPVAELYLPPITASPGNLVEFIGRVHTISPNSRSVPLVAAAYAWWRKALSLVQFGDGLTPRQIKYLRFSAFKAVSLVPPQAFVELSDWGRDHKVSEPFLETLRQIPDLQERESLLAQAVVDCIDCRSFYADKDFIQVVWRRLIAVESESIRYGASNVDDVMASGVLGRVALTLASQFQPDDDRYSNVLLEKILEFRKLALESILSNSSQKSN